MASNKLVYNSYFHMLQENFRLKFEEAKDSSWLICIPTAEALRGIEIDDHFVELHTLLPILDYGKPSCYTSSDSEHSLVVELEQEQLNVLSIHCRSADCYSANIISEEIGYNNKFQPYKMLVIDKVLSPEIIATNNSEEEWMKLNENISSLSQAHQFLFSCPSHPELLPQLTQSVAELSKEIAMAATLERACDILRHSVKSQWSTFLTAHPQHRQRDSRFQYLLSAALENFIASSVHEPMFLQICSTLSDEDTEIHCRTLQLSRLGVSSDQLGAPEDFSVPLPAAKWQMRTLTSQLDCFTCKWIRQAVTSESVFAISGMKNKLEINDSSQINIDIPVVELAALDSLQCPVDKLACIRASLDLIIAEVKGALVDVQSIAQDDEVPTLPSVASEDLVPLLTGVLIQAKPLHLVSNLFYMENCQWTLAPNDPLSDSLLTFRAALQNLLDIKVEELRPRNSKVHRELALQDLILVTEEIEQPDRKVTSPLDRQLDSIAAMIEASTRESRHQSNE